MTKFLRRTWSRYSKLGKRRKKKQVWRRPTGRDNKMRERRKGYPARVEVGYKTSEKGRKKIMKINNLKDLEKVQKDEIVILGKMGQKKKIEIVKKAKEKKIEISNLNVRKFLKKIEEKAKKKADEKKKLESKKTKKEEKIKEKSESAPKGVPSSEGKEKPKEAEK